MEFLFRKLRAYKLHTSAVCVSKVLGNSSNKDYSGVTFYRSRHYRLSSKIVVLTSFLENFQGGLQAQLKKTPHGYVTGKFPKFLLRFVSRTNWEVQKQKNQNNGMVYISFERLLKKMIGTS